MGKLNDWLSLAANFGVIAGIIFLAVEVNQNTEAQQAASGYSLLLNRVSVSENVMLNDDLAALMAKLRREEALSDVEQVKLEGFFHNYLARWNWEFGEFVQGRLALEQLPAEVYVKVISNDATYPTPGFRAFWEAHKTEYDSQFAAFLDGLLAEE